MIMIMMIIIIIIIIMIPGDVRMCEKELEKIDN